MSICSPREREREREKEKERERERDGEGVKAFHLKRILKAVV